MNDDKYMPEMITKDGDANPKSLAPLKFSKKSIFIIVAVAAVFLIATGALFVGLGKNSPGMKEDSNSAQNGHNPKVPSSDVQKAKDSLSRTLVYGSWRGNKSVITAVDLTTGTPTTVATLPLNIKKVSILTPQQLLYIDKTNGQDHGQQITSYLTREKKTGVVVKTSPGFGIDDYVLSPNKEYMAIWEVSLAKDTNVLKGGRSRVFGIKLSAPSNKYLLYDETANSPVHYPRAVLDNGRVFTDRFMPNDPAGGAGWAYGMGVSDYDGANKKDITQMQEGTYGTQPSLSPDGKFLVFGGYDGKHGDGKASPGGYRQAILTPTTVELLDTATLSRKKISNFTNNDIYPTAEWGASGNEVLVTAISKEPRREGLFVYDLTKKSLKRVNLPKTDSTYYSLVSSFSTDKYLIATVNDSQSNLGNLGDGYKPSLTKLLYFDSTTNQAVILPTETTYLQYLTTLPPKYFQQVLGTKTSVEGGGGNPSDPNVTIIDLYSDINDPKSNLQLHTFLLKPTLQIIREKQQSAPLPTPPALRGTINCVTLALEQCKLGSSNRNQCILQTKVQLKAEGKCNQSPLYLYGQVGQKVTARVLTTVYNDNPLYNAGYDVTLARSGEMLVGGKSYQAINYDYLPNLRRITAPTRGIVAKREDIEKVLRTYARKLGLNEKETSDVVRAGKTKTSSPYVFLSFFDHSTSQQILPLSFNPKPDNYLNVVFYFKQLSEKPNYTPVPPVFQAPLNRTGFTAVEISEMVE